MAANVRMHSDYNAKSLPQANACQAVVSILNNLFSSPKYFDADKDKPIVLADFGCATGKNSIEIFEKVVPTVQKLSKRPIKILMNDLPANNWDAVDEVVAKSELSRNSAVTVGKLPGSFYDKLTADGHIDLSISCVSVHWLPELPCVIPDHFVLPLSGNAAVHQLWNQTWHDGFVKFLKTRAKELRTGGHLVLAVPGWSPNETFMPSVATWYDVLCGLRDRGVLTEAELRSINIPAYPLSKKQMEAAFEEVPDQWDVVQHKLVLPGCIFTRLMEAGQLSPDGYIDSAVGFLEGWGGSVVRSCLVDRSETERTAIMDAMWEDLRAIGRRNIAKLRSNMGMHFVILQKKTTNAKPSAGPATNGHSAEKHQLAEFELQFDPTDDEQVQVASLLRGIITFASGNGSLSDERVFAVFDATYASARQKRIARAMFHNFCVQNHIDF